MLSQTELEKYKKRLIDMARRLGGDRAQLKEEVFQGNGAEASGGLSNVPVHNADLATHTYESEVNIGLVEQTESRIASSNAALARIDAGTYGVCQRCGKSIRKERLDALPDTPFCVECAAAGPSE